MHKTLLTALFLLLATAGFANHLKGGFFTYTYLGPGQNDPTKLRYGITLTVYMDCNATTQQINDPINFTIFDAGSGRQVENISVPIKPGGQYNLSKKSDEECITGDQRGCYYKIIVYELSSVELPANTGGYNVSYQRCCRIGGIVNIGSSNTIGNTYSINIPGSAVGADAPRNNSATFPVNDTAVICGGAFFTYPIAASDPDGNELTYEFCNAWVGGDQQNPAPPVAESPPYSTVPYLSGFSGSRPLGSGVTIDAQTGLISGTAPSTPGEYVITVCVTEKKDGKVIATTRKELHIRVGNCTPIKALLDPQYMSCDGYTLSFFNKQHSSEIKTYYWEFGDGATSTDLNPTHTYGDTGVYTLKLVVNRGESCSDSTTALVKVFPGFFPGFVFSGICVNKPTQFTDTTKTRYGVVDSWTWDFGDPSSPEDVSNVQNPAYSYPAIGTYKPRLIVTNSKGCVDTAFVDISIIDKPPLSMAFKDTLICNGDNVPLQAIGNGIFSWTPTSTLTNANTATPTAQPTVTTTYSVELNDNGCLNRDTVRVRVVNFVTLRAMADTTICAGDKVQLGGVTDGLRFSWTPAETVDEPAKLFTEARPLSTTTYQLTAIIGHCNATDDVTVKLVPYPIARAGIDTTICYQTEAQLKASMVASSFEWTPSESLTAPGSLSTGTLPLTNTTDFILTVRDVLGCPKPVSDTVRVSVLPKINAFAGNDTAVVVGQPVQLQASGGVAYQWVPPTDLNDAFIANPLAMYNGSYDSIEYQVLVYNEANCVDSAFMTVRIFKTNPSVFVPTAFTPNGDGKNDVFRPIAAGIARIEYFSVYNRWGQQVFSTTINGHGWDGKIKGKEQGSGTFAWLVKGIDYTGKVFFAKGTVTLVR